MLSFPWLSVPELRVAPQQHRCQRPETDCTLPASAAQRAERQKKKARTEAKSKLSFLEDEEEAAEDNPAIAKVLEGTRMREGGVLLIVDAFNQVTILDQA